MSEKFVVRYRVPGSTTIKLKVVDRGSTVAQVIALLSAECSDAFDCASLDDVVLDPDDCFDQYYESRDQLFVFSRAGGLRPARDFSAWRSISHFKLILRELEDTRHDHVFRIVVCGPSRSGLTSVIRRFAVDSFFDAQRPTTGVEFYNVAFRVAGTSIKLCVWDVSFRESYLSIARAYFRGAHGVLVAYDMTSRESFRAVGTWMGKLDSIVGRGVCRRLVGNKLDVTERRAVAFEEGAALARRLNVAFSEVSARDGTNVVAVFLALVDAILKRPEGWAAQNPGEVAAEEEEETEGVAAAETSELGCSIA
jgi:small GTP-binding protein